MRYLTLAIPGFLVWFLSACGTQKSVPQAEIPDGPAQYIDQYKVLAVREMQRTGIPASITLAQGLLESGSGQSELSRKANNHFGIKCKKQWNGATMKADDDRPNECFRAYASPEASYRDHSNFLLENNRYNSLFELAPDDYKGWARGLRRAGYATNSRYDKLLINLIEGYQLDRFDDGVVGQPIVPEPAFDEDGHPKPFTFNGLQATMVQEGEDWDSLSKRLEVSAAVLRRFNDQQPTDPLRPGMLLYLERKHRRSQQAEIHLFKEGETMQYVAQLYGIRLKRLYKLNRMEPEQRPAGGVKLRLQEKRDETPRLYFRTVMVKPAQQREPQQAEKAPEIETAAPPATRIPESTSDEKSSSAPKPAAQSKSPSAQGRPSSEEEPGEASEKTVPKKDGSRRKVHTVRAGETLYAISRQTSIPVDKLMKWNGLEKASLSVGQKLFVEAPSSTGPQPIRQSEADKTPSTKGADKENQDYIIYKVAPGDTLYSIAEEHDVGVNNISKANQMNSLDIEPGQKIKIPQYR
mgnify:CR=1 FL=1